MTLHRPITAERSTRAAAASGRPAADFRTEVPRRVPDRRCRSADHRGLPDRAPRPSSSASSSGAASGRWPTRTLSRAADGPGDTQPFAPDPDARAAESGYRPTPRPQYDGYRYRSDLERAATDLPTGPVSEPSAGTAYFGAAPAVGNLVPRLRTAMPGVVERYAAGGTGSGDTARPARNEGDARVDGEAEAPEPRMPETRAAEQPAGEPRTAIETRPPRARPIERRRAGVSG